MIDFSNGAGLVAEAEGVDSAERFLDFIENLTNALPVGNERWENEHVVELICVALAAGRRVMGDDSGMSWQELARTLALALWRPHGCDS